MQTKGTSSNLVSLSLQILRQYALVASFIQKIFSRPAKTDTSKKNTNVTESNGSLKVRGISKSEPRTRKDDLVILSNDDPNEDRLNALLSGLNIHETLGAIDDVIVDITLRTQLGQAPVIMLLFTVNDDPPDASTPDMGTFDGLNIITVSFEIGPNGRISIVDTMGLWDDDFTDNGENPDAETSDARKHEVLETQKKMARVLEISQDIGIFVEWIVRWLRQRKGSR